MFSVPERYRVRAGLMASTARDGNNGSFIIRSLKFKRPLFVVASDGGGWEHVSVSKHDRCPTWEEMTHVANLFWGPEDVLVQFRPAASQYVNNHPYCLHWWRQIDTPLQVPPSLLVGLKNLSG